MKWVRAKTRRNTFKEVLQGNMLGIQGQKTA